MDSTLTLGIIITILCTLFCPIIAYGKGRSAIGWFFGGFFLGLLGLIIVCCLSSISDEQDDTDDSEDTTE